LVTKLPASVSIARVQPAHEGLFQLPMMRYLPTPAQDAPSAPPRELSFKVLGTGKMPLGREHYELQGPICRGCCLRGSCCELRHTDSGIIAGAV
jgi:hypothetical protein